MLATLLGTSYEDTNGSGVLDAGDARLSGVVIYLDANQNGELDQRGFGLDPDEFQPGQVLNNARQTVFSSATAEDNQPAFRVFASDELARATTGQRVFGLAGTTDWSSDRRLRFDFTVPVDSVAIDVVGASANASPEVALETYDHNGELLQTDQIVAIGNGEFARLEIARSQKDIAFAIARVVTESGSVKFDNLRADDAGSERATLTADSGFYRFTNVPDGPTTIGQVVPEGYVQSSPGGSHQVTSEDGLVLTGLDFGNRTGAIAGTVFEDLGSPGPFDTDVDQAIEGAGVYLDVNRNGVPDVNTVLLFPDAFLEDQVLEFVSRFVTLTTVNTENRRVAEKVVASVDPATPGTKVFSREGDAAWTTERRFRAELDGLSNRVELTFRGAVEQPEVGRLVAYSVTGEVLETLETAALAQGDSETLFLQRDSLDIHSIVAYTSQPAGDSQGSLRITDFRAQRVREPIAITNRDGEFEFKPLVGGDYQVRTLPSDGLSPSFPSTFAQEVTVNSGESSEGVELGLAAPNQPPVAKNDFVTSFEDVGIVPIGVLVNDEDPDGQLAPSSVTITQSPQFGTAEVDPSGFINYQPEPDFFGRDTLLYHVQDERGAVSNTAVVTMEISSVNDAPVAVDDVAVFLGADATSIAVLRNDFDPDDPITVGSVRITNDPANGTAFVDPSTGVITYTPNVAGVDDTLTYTIEDSSGAVSNEATVQINALTEGNPPVANDDVATTLEGTSVDVNVLLNDTDPDGTLNDDSVFIVAIPANGTVQVGDNGAVRYQPDLGFIGSDVFSYRVEDTDDFVSNSANVTVTMSERDFPYQNPIRNLDVDGDGNVSPRDVLLIIREIDDRTISSASTGAVTQNPTPGTQPAGYFDVDGNGFVIGRDVLSVVIHLNELFAGNAEPPEVSAAAISTAALQTATAAVFAMHLDLLADDSDNEEDEDGEKVGVIVS